MVSNVIFRLRALCAASSNHATIGGPCAQTDSCNEYSAAQLRITCPAHLEGSVVLKAAPKNSLELMSEHEA